MHFMSHRGSSRLARVIPSMHGHLCVVWWLFSSPVSFSSPFRCSSSRPSRCPPPSSTRSSCPKTCATSAWGPWPVMTTRHPAQIHHGLNKLATDLSNKEYDDNEQETSTTKTEVFASASRSKAKAEPRRHPTACSSSRTVPIRERIGTDIEPGAQFNKRTQWHLD